MATMLITEALQQVKIVTDRLEKKRSFILKYATSNSRFIDPLAKNGGSAAAISAEVSAIADLERNLVNVRLAIQKKNLELNLTIEGKTKTVAEWLIWRREVSEGTKNYYNKLATVITTARTAHEKELKTASASTAEGQTVKESNIIVHLDELGIAKDSEVIGIILGTLDSKLSVLNATTSIEV